MSDRHVICESCDGDGGWEDCTGHYGGEPTYRWTPCVACDGSGHRDVFAARPVVTVGHREVFPADLDEEIPF